MSIKKSYIRIALGVLLLLLIYYYFKSILIYILIAGVLSLVGKRLMHLLARIKVGKYKLNRSLSAALVLLFFAFMMFSFFRIFIPLIINETNELSNINIQALENHFATEIEQVQNASQRLLESQTDFDLRTYLKDKLTSILELSKIRGFFSGIFSAIGDVFIALFSIFFMTFFFLKDEHLLEKMLLAFVPDKDEKRVLALVDKVVYLLGHYFIGLFIEVNVIITLVTLGLWAVGIGFSHAIIIGLIAGMLNVIPYVGPLISMGIGLIISIATLLSGDVPDNLMMTTILVLIVFMITQLIDNFLLQPVIYSKSVNATPLEIFIVILMAGSLGGILGMILAIPIYTLLRIIAKETLGQFKVVQKITDNI